MSKKSRFEFECPLKISFTADRDISNDALQKLALKHLEMAFKIEIIEVDEKRLSFVREIKILTPEEERAEREAERAFNEFFKGSKEAYDKLFKGLGI